MAARTWENYEWHVRRLKAAAGHLSLWGLTAGTLQEALAKLTGSARTVRDSYATLRTALRQAVGWGMLPSNPTAGLRTPKVPRTEKRVLTREELERLLDAARHYKHHLVIRLLGLTGLRLGEVLALRWRDVDLAHGTATVCQSVDLRRRTLKDTKTDAAVRAIRLDPETVALLREHRRSQAESPVTPLRRGADLVFRASDGRPLKESAVRKTLNRALRKAGIDHIRVHDLRHICICGERLEISGLWKGRIRSNRVAPTRRRPAKPRKSRLREGSMHTGRHTGRHTGA